MSMLPTTTTWTVHVDEFDTQTLLNMAVVAVSGPSLLEFLQDSASEYLHEEIGLRFAYEGDRKSGNWPPLADATNEIRDALGYPAESPINIRTGDLEEWVTTAASYSAGSMEASMDLPGEAPDGVLAEKLRTAQEGEPASRNPFPGAGMTPPRPVLAVNEEDMAELLLRLEAHIVKWIVGMAA